MSYLIAPPTRHTLRRREYTVRLPACAVARVEARENMRKKKEAAQRQRRHERRHGMMSAEGWRCRAFMRYVSAARALCARLCRRRHATLLPMPTATTPLSVCVRRRRR